MKKITPELFKEKFDEVIKLQHISPRISTEWNNWKVYTGIILGEVVPLIAEKLGLSSYNKDYYWLDAVIYEELDEVHFKNGTTYAKYIAVAIEHENDSKSTVVEMNKLQIYNSPLKVLITYPGHEDKIDNLLSMYTRIMESSDVFSDFSSHRKQLVIFGIKSKDDKVDWIYYVYEGSRFIRF
jgi:hypothetical protein